MKAIFVSLAIGAFAASSATAIEMHRGQGQVTDAQDATSTFKMAVVTSYEPNGDIMLFRHHMYADGTSTRFHYTMKKVADGRYDLVGEEGDNVSGFGVCYMTGKGNLCHTEAMMEGTVYKESVLLDFAQVHVVGAKFVDGVRDANWEVTLNRVYPKK